MGDPITGMAVSAAGTVAGAKAGQALGMGGSDSSNGNASYVNGLINNMNATLQNALTQAIGTNTQYTNQAVNQQNSSLAQALANLGSGLTNATNVANQNVRTGQNQYMALNAPLSAAGYNALDSYEDSLGLARPAVGNAALAQSLYNTANLEGAKQQLMNSNGSLNAPTAPTAPVAPNLQKLTSAVTPQQIYNYMQQNQAWTGNRGGIQDYTGVGASLLGNSQMNQQLKNALGNPQVSALVQQYLGQQAYNNAMNQYNTALPQYQQQQATYNNNLSNFNNYQALANSVSPQQQSLAAAYSSGNIGSPVRI